MNGRGLALRREALTELTTDELAGLAGAVPPPPTPPEPRTLDLADCLLWLSYRCTQ